MKKKFSIILLICLVHFQLILSQERFTSIENELARLSQKDTSLLSAVNVSVMDVTLHEFLRGLAISNSINLSVSPNLKKHIVVNFNNVNVKSVLLFLAREHDLDIKIIGNIISIEEFDNSKLIKKEKKEISVNYNSSGDLLSVELNNDTLREVAKQISKVSGKNVLVSPEVEEKTVSAYINKMPFESVLKNIGLSNQLLVEKTDDGFFLIKAAEKNDVSNNTKGGRKNRSKGTNDFELKVQGFNRFDISATDANINELIQNVSSELKINYFLLSKVEGTISIYANGINYETFLETVLQGLEFSFKKEKGIYVIGSLKSELETTYVYEWEFRSVEKIVEFIPATYKTGIEIIEFHELNSLFLTGKKEKVEEAVEFMKQIDRPVPLITIEVIIVDVSNNHTTETGVKMGYGTNPDPKTSNSVFPKVDLTLSTQSINGLINSFNGLGWVNLGKVTPQFYVNLKALEENGVLEIKSTPKLSTLNGHEATLVSGETKYYGEEKQSYYGSQNPALSKIKEWKAIDANLSLKIKPIVSSDEQITLSVQLEQSEFTQSQSTEEDGPPGKLNRSFNSLIRVNDEEIVLLGGLERNTKNQSASGVPLLSRIPIIKYLFSSRVDKKTKSKLSIFIKPTILK